MRAVALRCALGSVTYLIPLMVSIRPPPHRCLSVGHAANARGGRVGEAELATGTPTQFEIRLSATFRDFQGARPGPR